MKPEMALHQMLKRTSDCNTGCNLSANLEGEGFETRECHAPTPFFVRYCRNYSNGLGYPAGSFVYDECGYYFNLERETRSPRDAKSVWVQFTGLDMALAFATFLANIGCEAPAEGVSIPATSNSGTCGNGEASCS